MATAREPATLLDLGKRYRPGELVLDGRSGNVPIGDRVTAVKLRRSMHEAPTITLDVLDPDYSLVRDPASPLGSSRRWNQVLLSVDGTRWALMEAKKTRRGFELVFYDEAVAKLKAKRGPVKLASRADVTRAQFIGSLCKRANVGFVSPDRDKPQPIEPLSKDDRERLRETRKSRETQGVTREYYAQDGVARLRKADVTVKTRKASSGQLQNMATVLSAADEEGAGPKARKALVEACIVESEFQNLTHGHSTSIGILQLLNSHLGGSTATSGGRRDVALVSRMFLRQGFTGRGGAIELARVNTGWTAGQVAQAVQGSAYPDRYDEWSTEADRILRAWGGDGTLRGAPTGTPDRAYVEQYGFRVEPRESYWGAIQRLAEEVDWRAFVVTGTLWFASEKTLARGPVAMTIREGRDTGTAQGVDEILWSWTARRRIDEMRVTAVLTPWAAPPGSPVLVEDQSPTMEGPWLVGDIARDLLDDSGRADITLVWPTRPDPEPASTVTVVPGNDPIRENRPDRAGGIGRRGRVTYNGDTERGLQQGVKTFLELMAGKTDEPVIVTSGLRPGAVTTSGNVSDHAAGNAADLGVGGDARHDGKAIELKGDRLAIAALRLAGMSYAEAEEWCRGLAVRAPYNGTWTAPVRVPRPLQQYSVQIIWKSDGPGVGNHYNHVHVGVKPI